MLRFCFGASGSGKSTRLYNEVIERSMRDLGTNYIIIVPDQFTMQTQKDVVRMHPSHAIMNIDVLSFGRLSHRIFEEAGLSSFSVLDDLGKSLVLRRVSDILGDKLPIIGKNMHKPGYIDEVKSTISEFMQYGIGDEELAILEEKSSKKGALNAKIKDLRLLYREFLAYIKDKYITTEETLDVLCGAIPSSKILKDCVIVFDGFTGFTPIQYRVIRMLLSVSKEVIVSLTISPEDDPYTGSFEEQELFMLSKKTVYDLEKLEYSLLQEQGAIGDPSFEAYRNARNEEMSQNPKSGDIFITDKTVKRLENNPSLAFLEQNLFRYNANKFTADTSGIEMALRGIEGQLKKNEQKKAMLCDLLEDGTYSREIFRERMDKAEAERNDLLERREQIKLELNAARVHNKEQTVTAIDNVLDLYPTLSPEGKNQLLKAIIRRVVYHKEKKTPPMAFSLDIELQPL